MKNDRKVLSVARWVARLRALPVAGLICAASFLFERDGLLNVKAFEVFVAVVLLKASNGSCHAVNRGFAIALGFLQIDQIFALDAFVFGVVRCHGLVFPIRSHCSRRARRSRLCVAVPAAA